MKLAELDIGEWKQISIMSRQNHSVLRTRVGGLSLEITFIIVRANRLVNIYIS